MTGGSPGALPSAPLGPLLLPDLPQLPSATPTAPDLGTVTVSSKQGRQTAALMTLALWGSEGWTPVPPPLAGLYDPVTLRNLPSWQQTRPPLPGAILHPEMPWGSSPVSTRGSGTHGSFLGPAGPLHSPPALLGWLLPESFPYLLGFSPSLPFGGPFLTTS